MIHRVKEDLVIPLEKWNDVAYINKILGKRKKLNIVTRIDSIDSIIKKPYGKNAGDIAVRVFNALCEADTIYTSSPRSRKALASFCSLYKITPRRQQEIRMADK